jgi:hypothetical protein
MLLKLGHFKKHTRNSFKYINEATGNSEKTMKRKNVSDALKYYLFFPQQQ